jgi:hypothetical protein
MRISTTTIESYRLFMQADQEWMQESELLDTIAGKFTGNHKVWLGSAFGTLLENPDPYRVAGGYRIKPRGSVDVFEFGDEVMGPVFALIPRDVTVFEAKAVKRYGAHDVVAKADQLTGTSLIETKATLGQFDFDRYAASCQWRFMADIFQPASVTYHVVCLDEDDANHAIRLRGIHTFSLYPYVGLEDDCRSLVNEFADYVTAHGLAGVLDRRQAEAA